MLEYMLFGAVGGILGWLLFKLLIELPLFIKDEICDRIDAWLAEQPAILAEPPAPPPSWRADAFLLSAVAGILVTMGSLLYLGMSFSL